MELMSSVTLGLLALTFATAAPLQSSQSSTSCCISQADRLSPKIMKNLLRQLDPLKPPSLGKNVRLSGTVVLEVKLDATGKLLCVRAVSGHPLIVGSATDAITRSEFASPPRSQSSERCGKLILRYRATEYSVGVSIAEK